MTTSPAADTEVAVAPPQLLLLDTASLYFRAYFGVKDLREAPDGTPTNAIRGLLDMIATLVGRFSPTHLACCWDNDWRPDFRVQAIPSYKSHRLVEGSEEKEEAPPELEVQVPILRRVLEAVGIPVLGADGYEADDVIGTLTARHRGRLPVGVVTGDRDLFQLVDDASGTRVIYTARGGVRDPDVVTEAFLADKYAVASGDAYADMAALRGDTSDGLPGVKGIGDKTAAALIADFGSLAGVREAVASGDPRIKGARRANLEAASDYLDVAPLVVRVAHDVPIPDVDLRLPSDIADPATMSRLAVDHGLTSPFDRIATALRG